MVDLDKELQALDIITFTEHPDYCGMKLRDGQRTILKAIYGMKLTDEEFEIYKIMTGDGDWVDTDGTEYPQQFPQTVTEQHGLGEEAGEILLVCGRRSGKSLGISVPIVLYETICRAHIWKQYIQKDEDAFAIIVATRLDQAKKIIQAQCTNTLLRSPKLSVLIEEKPKTTEIKLANGLTIMSLPCTGTAGRGIPCFCLALDEAAHFRFEGKETDESIFQSIEPAMFQFEEDDKPEQPLPKRILLSSPAAEQGMFWEWFVEDSEDGNTANFQVPGRATFQAPTRLVNEAISARRIAKIKKKDIDYWRREIAAHFAKSMDAFFPASVQLCYMLDGDLARRRGILYHAGIDQSGLTGRDRFAFAIAHMEPDGTVVNDCIRQWETVELEDIMGEIKAICGDYLAGTVTHDKYGAGWVSSKLAEHGLESNIRPALPVIYTNAKALVIGRMLKLQDDPELRAGMANTMAVYGKNNSLSIYHDRSSDGHADLADAVCTAVFEASAPGEDVEEEVILLQDTTALLDGRMFRHYES